MSVGPELSTINIFYITKYSEIIFCSVFTPSCDCNIFPTAITTTRIGDHDLVMSIAQQLYFGQPGIWCINTSYLYVYSRRGCFNDVGCMCIEKCSSRDPFLQQQK